MIRIHAVFAVAKETANSFYLPVPCRGNIKAVRAVYSEETDEDETITLERGTDDVFVCTPPADSTAEGVSFEGVADSTYGEYIFDPDSSTVANRVIKVTVPSTFDTAGQLGLSIDYDDSAAVSQAASEA